MDSKKTGMSGKENEQEDGVNKLFSARLNEQLDRVGFPAAPHRVSKTMQLTTLSNTQVYRILNGIAQPTLKTMATLRTLGVSFDEIFDRMNISRPQVAIVDDDESDVEASLKALEEHFLVTRFNRVEDFLKSMEYTHYDAFVVDWSMKKGGDYCLEKIRADYPDAPIILISGKATEEQAGHALTDYEVTYFPKPAKPVVITSAIKLHLQRSRMKKR